MTIRPGEALFTRLALQEFAFLSNYGFVSVEISTTRVKWEARRLFLQVYHGRQTYIINLEFGLIGEEEFPCDMALLLEFVGANEQEYQSFKPVHDRQEIASALRKQAGYLRKYGQPILRDDLGFVRTVRQFSANKQNASLRDASFEQAMTLAENYWKRGEYYRVVYFLKPYQDKLPQSLREKFDQALSHLSTEEKRADTWK